MEKERNVEELYREALTNFIKEQSEQHLYKGLQLSRKTMEYNISPEEIINWHKDTLIQLFPEIRPEIIYSFDFLIEMMMWYGISYSETQSLRHIQQELQTEMEVAANLQRTLLETKIPEINQLEIGTISVPAKRMNGDYHHFMLDEKGRVGVAIADVIGKGIPAALCMAMIKYAMDSIPNQGHMPSNVLQSLNNVVEQNVEESMFITMLYGLYDPELHTFSYSSAGHEPAMYYSVKNDQFEELQAKGLLLGINKNTTYRQYDKHIEIGDFIILMSDGVTECRTEKGFIERDYVMEIIKENLHLRPKEIVLNVFKHLEKLQDFQLRDDFTLILIKRIE